METYIRKSLGMRAHWVTEGVKTEEGWIARVDPMACSPCDHMVSYAVLQARAFTSYHEELE